MPRSLFRRWKNDERGVSAVEFALVAPVMILFYAGLVDLCQGYMALKRTSHVAAMIADMASQSGNLTKSQIDDIFEIGPAIMTPFASASLEQRVSSVTRISSTKYKVDWSRSYGAPGSLSGALTAANVSLPADVLANGESILIGESAYTYNSLFQMFAPTIRFQKRALIQPRGTSTTCSDC
jgi:Flp pilus assembly protein TadG